jgi:hypothetical protein
MVDTGITASRQLDALGRPFTADRSLRQIIDLASRPSQPEETWCRGSAHAALKVPSARRREGR